MTNRLAHPRPEYPRPERQRGFLEGVDWLNLNGPWQFRFDPDRHGVEEQWFLPGNTEWRQQIIVPFCWESLAAWGEGDAAGNENYYSPRVFLNPLEVTKLNHRSAQRYEVGWYRREVIIPNHPAWQHKRVILTIGAADFFTDAWCNGKLLGHHEGGYTPFEFDLTETLHAMPDGRRRGLLVLRVEDPMDNREQPVGKQWRWYTPASGIWQTVFVEPRSSTHLGRFRFTSDIEAGTLHMKINCLQAGSGCAVKAQITLPSQAEAQVVTIPVVEGVAEQILKIEPLLLWGPNRPHLYPTRLSLQRDGVVLDSVRTYFGMRSIDFATLPGADAPVALRLNRLPRYLRGALYQSYHPDGVYTAGDAEVLRQDIESAKKFGFNFLRVHIKVDDPLLLYYADKLGILLMADFPNFGEGGDTPLGRQRFETMMRETIERDYNHPSIFAWCMFNETWGFGGQAEFADQLTTYDPRRITRRIAEEAAAKIPKAKLANLHSFPWVQKMWELAKQLDPTRLIEDMSVCHWEHLDYYQHGDTDINSWHFYIDDYEKAKAHIQKVVQSTFLGSSFNYVPGYHHKGQPLINSEYGGIGALDGDVDISWSFKFLTNELRRYPQIAAYIYTELHDVEWEYNGFLNYDRTPKEFGYDPAVINESNALPIDAPPIQRVAPGQRLEIPVAFSHYSREEYKDVWLQWRLSGIDEQGQMHSNLAFDTLRIPFPHLRVAPASNIKLQMPVEPMLCTFFVEACTKQKVVAQNFVHLFVATGYPPLREDVPRGVVLRGTPGNYAAAEWSGEKSSRELEQRDDACFGSGSGFFEWKLPLTVSEYASTRRIRLFVEASSCRLGAPQTDGDIYSTLLSITLNGLPVYQGTLRNHPHDARGVLSYLRGCRGAYGYLIHAFAEGELLKKIVAAQTGSELRLRCAVPKDSLPQGGLTIYGAESGRYPVCPTVMVEF